MPEKHFYEQKDYTKEYLIPYFSKHIPRFTSMKTLEIGCAEGGLIVALKELGLDARGIELSNDRAELGNKMAGNSNIIVGDITDPELVTKIGEKFDLIIMREVIEHLHEKERAFNNLYSLLNDGGYLFISFPPKFSPFAGHQQIGKSFLKAMPYLHLLPVNFLKFLEKKLNENSTYIDEIKLHYSTGCTIKKFESLSRDSNLTPVIKELFLFRPVYARRFGLPTIKIPGIPLLREMISFGCEALLQKR